MRYGVKHKEQSRERILQAAAKSFRGQGRGGGCVVEVMESAGLTHGGFYKHFASKDQLLEEAIGTALQEVSARIAQMTEGMDRALALGAVINFYLSEEHLKHPERGCALAALGTEMARMAPAMKAGVNQAMDEYVAALSYLMPGETRAKRQAAFRILFSSMAGCLMTARAYVERKRQRQILAGGRAFFKQAFCALPASGALEAR